jgi:hypothetical protein
MKRTRQKRHFYARTILLIAFLAAAAMLGSMMLHKYLARHQTPQTPVQPKPAGTVPVTLFFSSADGSGFVRETREIEGSCNSDISPCIRAILEELANGPLGDLAPTIPQNSSFRSIQIQGDTAVIDLGASLVEGLPEGSSAEMTAIYSMVNTSIWANHWSRISSWIKHRDNRSISKSSVRRTPFISTPGGNDR